MLAQLESVTKDLRVGLWPIFCIYRFCPGHWKHAGRNRCRTLSTVKSSVTLLTEMIEPTVEALGLELWGVEHIQQGRYSLLRIYIERDQGITIEDCANVSRQVGAVLDVEDPITSEYTLEVSSPGLDRPLFTARQFEQFVGSEVSLRLHSAVRGRRKFKGSIARVDEDSICLQVDGSDYELRHADIEKASIVYKD